MDKIKIKINGEEKEFDKDLTVGDLVRLRNVSGMFVIEKNRKIIGKLDFDNEKIIDGDEIEIVGFAGGG